MTQDVNWDLEADVVVLGSGGAAMTAAIAAHDFGAKDVVILEKTGMVGGSDLVKQKEQLGSNGSCAAAHPARAAPPRCRQQRECGCCAAAAQ